MNQRRACPVVLGTRVILVPITLQDVTDRYVSWLNDPEVTKTLSNRSFATFESVISYVKFRLENPEVWFWKIILVDSNLHIGNLKFEPILFEKKYAIYGIMIGDKSSWGKGFANEATSLCLKAAFEIAQIDTVFLGVYRTNQRAIRTYERTGFTECTDHPFEANQNTVVTMKATRSVWQHETAALITLPSCVRVN